jgi:hypothetical protein
VPSDTSRLILPMHEIYIFLRLAHMLHLLRSCIVARMRRIVGSGQTHQHGAALLLDLDRRKRRRHRLTDRRLRRTHLRKLAQANATVRCSIARAAALCRQMGSLVASLVSNALSGTIPCALVIAWISTAACGPSESARRAATASSCSAILSMCAAIPARTA